jgi:NAD(P)-dependent dehydrogenase (short-subunit alcohol dehydrogenase family)
LRYYATSASPRVRSRKASNARVTLLKCLGKPLEVVGAVTTLASDADSFISGQTFVVDGGQSLA